MSERAERCETCRFWGEGHGDTGPCRRHAPHPIANHSDEGTGEAHWPFTGPNDWCGEWQGKDEQFLQKQQGESLPKLPTAPQLRCRLAELMREQRMLRGMLRVIERKQGDDKVARRNEEALRQEAARKRREDQQRQETRRPH